MAPPAAKVNTIADALVARLLTIDKVAFPDVWYSKPAAVKREYEVSDATIAERPCLLVMYAGREFEARNFGDIHGVRVRFEIDCITDRVSPTGKELVELMRDVVRAIHQDESLGGTVHYAWPVSDTAQVEAMASSGLGIGTVVVDAWYEHSHDAP